MSSGNVSPYEKIAIALCRAHREWPSGEDEDCRQPLLRSLREALEGKITDLHTLSRLEAVVEIVNENAPEPLSDDGLKRLRQASEKLVMARADTMKKSFGCS